jgi:hypothetical protein
MKPIYIFIDPDGTADVGLCLIVQHPTGVVYANQCGGFATEEKPVEGYLVPLGNRKIEDEIFDFFWREFGGHCYWPNNRWTEDRVRELNGILTSISCWTTPERGAESQCGVLQLDTSRIEECIEAWIPVLSPMGKGILILGNSD